MSSAPASSSAAGERPPVVEWRLDKRAQALQDKCPTDGPFVRALARRRKGKVLPRMDFGAEIIFHDVLEAVWVHVSLSSSSRGRYLSVPDQALTLHHTLPSPSLPATERVSVRR